jgi:hypothetical protein
MGRKDKKSHYKKQFVAFISDNRIVLAALGGVAMGIALAKLLGPEKARKLISVIEDSVKNLAAHHVPVGKLQEAN